MAEETVCVEILMAVYNGQHYLRQQLDSILAQSWRDWHLTASDDASTDDSLIILNTYADQYPDRISVQSHTNGFGSARDHFFRLMETCKKPYMMFCDQDDIWHTEKVALTIAAMRRAEAEYGSQTPLLVFTDAAPVSADRTPICPSLMRYQQQDPNAIRDFRKILLQNVVTGCTCMINQPLRVKALTRYTPQDALMHDWWLAAVVARFGRGIYVPTATIEYRLHGTNQVGAKDFRSLRYTLTQMNKLSALRAQIRKKKAQARAFLAAYGDELTADERAFLSDFAREKSGILFYARNRKLFYGVKRFLGTLFMG